MYYTHRSKLQLRLANATFLLLFLVAVALLQLLGRDFSVRVDLTATGRHSLSKASIEVLKRLDGPVRVTAYVPSSGKMRAQILDFVAVYQRRKPDIGIAFVDIDQSPNEVRAAGAHEGELVLEYGDAKERLTPPARLDEESFTNALTRLGHRSERWIVFLSGHGERSPDRSANFDLSIWAGELRKRGFMTRALTLAESRQIPQNTAALVIAGPRVRLLPGELKAIQQYVEHGGNLLWLADPGPQQGLESLAEMLGVEFPRGVLVDPESARQTQQPDAIVIANYGPHPVVRDFGGVQTVFPHAAALQINVPKDWQALSLLDTQPSAWLETGALTLPMNFDRGSDIRGPLTLGAALTRSLEKFEQRVVVIGNGAFLSNQFLGNVGNLDLGLSLVNWLSRDDAYVSIPVRVASDRRLELAPATKLALLLCYFGLPFGAGTTGVIVWWRRRKR